VGGTHKKLSIAAARAIEESKQKAGESKGFLKKLFNQKKSKTKGKK